MQNIIIQPYIPNLYRYLEEEFVDLFFNKKILRISSFEKYKQHQDNARKDTEEGKATLRGKCIDSNISTEMGFGVSNCFTLCTSLVKSQEVAEIFKCDSCIEIIEPLNFMIAISDALVKQNYIVNRIMPGSCFYKDIREIYKDIEQKDIDKINIDDVNHTMDFNALFALGNKIASDDIYFLKSIEYSNQHEYRIVWNVSNNPIPEYIDLCVPNAVQFCRKVDLKGN